MLGGKIEGESKKVKGGRQKRKERVIIECTLKS